MSTIRKEDTVEVIAGKDKGKRGKVQQMLTKDRKLMVEGANIIKRHTRPNPQIRQAGIVQKESPLSLSKVMLVCSHCDKAVKVGHSFLDDGKKVRVCRSCKEVID